MILSDMRESGDDIIANCQTRDDALTKHMTLVLEEFLLQHIASRDKIFFQCLAHLNVDASLWALL